MLYNMKLRLSDVCKSILMVTFLSSCVLFTLNYADSVQDNLEVVNLTDHQTDEINVSDHKNDEIRDEYGPPIEAVEPKLDPQLGSTINQEYVFADALSQNSGISNGLVDTGQPVLITLVDSAAGELAEAARNADIIDSGKKPSNISEASSDYPINVEELNLPIELNDSNRDVENASSKETQEIPKSDSIEKAIPKDIEKNSTLRDAEDDKSGNVTDDKVPINENVTESTKDNIEKEEIPSFSEWAQKQLEEAEKNKETVVNDSSQLIHNVHISTINLKVRSKNYASPDCGAKIVAANPEAGSAGFILSPSRDEYMLNTCNSRIWFIVELCEAIQAKKVELANFELFSSTPKNFSVSVSDRFPSREWAGVGQFIAKDERDIQTFNLHPHLFGKFIRVELHSHYGSEHYCPISLFRVYGTSEFEVFETENSPSQTNQINDDDDDDDVLEDLVDPEKNGDVSRNLFGSARDAVMSIMKKAAEVLVKSGDSRNSSSELTAETSVMKKCRTPSHIIVCDNCSNSLFTDVYDLMSCHGDYLKGFVESPIIYNVLCNTDMCQHYGLDFKSKKTLPFKTEIASYISALLMPSYMAALCNMLAIIEKKVVLNTSYETDLNITSNLTIDKKVNAIGNDDRLMGELLQEPFSTCNGDKEYCKDKILNEIQLDSESSLKSSTHSNINTGTIADIKPTKTLPKDMDSIEPSIITVHPSIESSDFTHSIKVPSSEYDIESSEVNKMNDPFGETNQIETENKQNQSIDSSVSNSEQTTIHKDKTENVVLPSQSALNDDISNSVVNSTMEDTNASQEQISLDNLLIELEQVNNDPSTPAPPQNTILSPHQGQKESVFLRLSNRIKALEKNMSLSGQYLEELSRRYKKQVEEMQRTFEKTLLTMTEESKRSEERDHKNNEEMLVLQQQIAQLSTSVSALLLDRDSFLGNPILLKFLLFQVLLTVFVVYIFRRFQRKEPIAPDKRTNKVKRTSLEKVKLRRNSVGVISIEELHIKNRSSDEAISNSSPAIEMNDGNGTKSDKKKKKRKTSCVQRSLSIAVPPSEEYTNFQSNDTMEEIVIQRDISNGIDNLTHVALEEPEFIAPEVELVDFENTGEFNLPKYDEIFTPKREFPKTNGSIFGMKPLNKKPEKMRRLSSPAFLKAALGRQSIKITDEPELNRSISNQPSFSDKETFPMREVKSEERELMVDMDSPPLNDWSSAGDLSQASSSTTTDSSAKTKRSKKRSFKNMLRKVF